MPHAHAHSSKAVAHTSTRTAAHSAKHAAASSAPKLLETQSIISHQNEEIALLRAELEVENKNALIAKLKARLRTAHTLY